LIENINLAIAFAAGIISFLSPCILPIIPSYLSFIGGISAKELTNSRTLKWGIFINTLFFVLGFSIIFIFFGIVFSSMGTALSGISNITNKIAGIIVILFGLNFIFSFWKLLNIEKKFYFKKKPNGIIGSVLLGMAFAGGWTPCIGPILASILFLAGTTEQGLRGSILLASYSVGLGVPFVLAGLFISFFQKRMEKLKQHLNIIKSVSGIFLIMIGILIFSGNLARLNIFFFNMARNLESWSQENPLGPRILFGISFLILPITMIFFYIKHILMIKKSSNLKIKDFILPVRLTIIISFISLSALSFSGILDISKIVVSWFVFQGI